MSAGSTAQGVRGEILRAMWTSPDARFACTTREFDPHTGEVQLAYQLCGGSSVLDFTEIVRLPVAEALPPDRLESLEHVLALLHAVAGVSYYKAVAPPTIALNSAYTQAELDFIAAAYQQGMREYAYTNALDAALTPTIEHAPPVPPATGASVAFQDARPLVPCGGGKDSIVTIEAVRRSGRRPITFAVNPKRWIHLVMQMAGTDTAVAQREIDPLLLELNAAGARNGHVPVTAINSLIALATALVIGAGPVVMSNESSASIPNLVWNGVEVNHQWAKSLEAERLLSAALASRANPVRYFSLLRHLNEVQIAQLYSRITGYDSSMTSCNRAFTMDAAAHARWCRDCPKCRFVFLVLAPFFGRERLVALFGGNMLDDAAQVDGYRRLLGLGGPRPFECVGDIDESHALLLKVGTDPDWGGTHVVQALLADVAGRPRPAWSDVLARRSQSLAPLEWLEALDALA